MTEHDELVKRLEKAAEDREFIPPKTVRAWITPRDAEEAAQAIKRLGRERQEMIVERDDCLEELAEAQENKPSAELDLKATEDAFEEMAKQIDECPLGIPANIYVDRHWAILLRGAVTMARSNYDAFHSCLERMTRDSKELAEARAEIERKNEALRRIADANVLDMNTLHPDGIQQEAREALATPAPKPDSSYPNSLAEDDLLKEANRIFLWLASDDYDRGPEVKDMISRWRGRFDLQAPSMGEAEPRSSVRRSDRNCPICKGLGRVFTEDSGGLGKVCKPCHGTGSEYEPAQQQEGGE